MQVLCISCAILIFTVIIYKTILFSSSPKYRRKLVYWFYFNRYERVNSGSERSLRFKRRQNGLSITLLVLIPLTLICLLIWRQTSG